ncbi:MFS transporter [Pseudoclavibacter sp. RFBJ3]|uniref:MFS transporter n=2 Tax=Pseudoclavibacter TaxID=255204 RepID=UPI000CE80981|nr:MULTISPECIES: MFS transporter [unclassified Pseudoclavibacter]PPF80013.1 MFS transporter [Pseudoclavibacter sp. RFBJ5]PPF95385.1 MFS transporter [Pseudoclavibacter sp. RFBJ3]PPG19455.1 MFS transporter [Pseudoclavibacter sp. RFBI4]
MHRLRSTGFASIAGIVGFLAFVEFTSGILQGYYTPLLTDIARHLGIHDADVNWLEGAQLMLSALVVPVLAKLGDMIGQRKVLLASTAVTALASFGLVFAQEFWMFLVAWALQGFYVIWLPLEIALIWSRTRERPNSARLTRTSAGVLVAALQLGAIAGALSAGALAESLPVQVLLLIPAIAVALCFFVILFGVKESPSPVGGKLDYPGLLLLSLALLSFTGGLSLLRVTGPGDLSSWLVVLLGLAGLALFARVELGRPDPLIDVRLFRSSALWPVFLTAGLFGVSVLGAQAPLSTFARTDPSVYGYGLGASAGQTSILIGSYVLSMVVGALLYSQVTKLLAPRVALIGASGLVATGYLLFLPFHDGYLQAVTNMVIAGIGSGALVAALPSAAAAAAPATQTGVATGLTNSVKTLGGAMASCVFGIALLGTLANAPAAEGTAGSLAGYFTVWTVCGLTAVAAAIALCFVPKAAFQDAPERADRPPVVA